MSKEESAVIEHNETDRQWLQIIEEWRQSGMSIAEWCRDNDYSYSQFYKQKVRLFPDEVRKSEFMEQGTTWSAVTLEIPSSTLDVYVGECRVVVTSGFDQDLFREVVEVLKNAH